MPAIRRSSAPGRCTPWLMATSTATDHLQPTTSSSLRYCDGSGVDIGDAHTIPRCTTHGAQAALQHARDGHGKVPASGARGCCLGTAWRGPVFGPPHPKEPFMKSKAVFYHAGCPVCVEAEHTVARALDPARYELEVV